MTDDRLDRFSKEMARITYPLLPLPLAEELARLVRKELDREYRRGFTAGIAAERRGNLPQ